eukprot:TRINITY_DN40605_c0_g1_i1.p1 TRINITY_DN40605_c0_g1~~TRINITY_DN40605_c0_g1_i1.p1  ORF type:complete len:204 (+),score=28.39 TRINITY_DN40605_c0_g1_i1:159-770(+)
MCIRDRPGFAMVSNGKRARLCAQKIQSFDFRECATYVHDACYLTCGTKFSRCTELFQQCMTAVCRDNYPTQDYAHCTKGVEKLLQGVRMLGGIGFQSAQKHACDCVSSDEATALQEDELTSFYEAWAPEHMSKVPKLIEQFVGQGKFPYVMLALRQKYKDSVVVDEPSEEDLKAHDEAVKLTAKQWADKNAGKGKDSGSNEEL